MRSMSSFTLLALCTLIAAPLGCSADGGTDASSPPDADVSQSDAPPTTDVQTGDLPPPDGIATPTDVPPPDVPKQDTDDLPRTDVPTAHDTADTGPIAPCPVDGVACEPDEATTNACVTTGTCLGGSCLPVVLPDQPTCADNVLRWCELGSRIDIDCTAQSKLCLAGACLFNYAEAWNDAVEVLALSPANTAHTTDDLANGTLYTDAAAEHGGQGTFACLAGDKLWLKSQSYYALDGPIPARSRVTATVTPVGDSKPGIYLIAMDGDSFSVPPASAGTWTCVTDYPQTSLSAPHSVNWDNLTNANANIVAVVVSNATAGNFDLDLTIEPLTEPCLSNIGDQPSWPPFVRQIPLDPAGKATIQGDAADGLPICDAPGNFDWATSNACFTNPEVFAGPHTLFGLQQPLDNKWSLAITATPDPGVDLRLYGWRMAGGNFYTPPHDAILSTCEAQPSVVAPAPASGQARTISFLSLTAAAHTNIFFGVTALGGKGGYTIDVKWIPILDDVCPEDLFQTPSAWPATVQPLPLTHDPDGLRASAHLSGDVANGAPMCTLAWAENSTVACFPGTRNHYFDGHHELYALTEPVPPNSTLYVTVTPAPGVDVSAYGYWQGTTYFYTPPFLPSVGACEASYPLSIDGSGNPGEPETFLFMNAGSNTYNYVIGVAGHGPDGTEGAYTLDVELIEAPGSHCPESLPGATYSAWPTSVAKVALPPEDSGLTFSGDLTDGACVDLTWAQNSQVACFPGTRFGHFEGNHVMYALDDPIPPNSLLTITAVPHDGVDVSLYGYQIGEHSHYVPPAVHGVVSCEASYPLGIGVVPNPDEPETIQFFNPSDTNRYNIFFAAAGPTGVTTGGYDIVLDLQVAETWCEESLPGDSFISWPAHVTQVPLDGDGHTLLTSQDLADGSCVNLGFASTSDNACFPDTRFEYFQGNHRFYALAQPLPPRSTVTITATPDPDIDVSLYGYQVGTDAFPVPPNVHGATRCEASYPLAIGFEPDPGGAEWITFYNPSETASYNVFFTVAGTREGGDQGAFEIEVQQDTQAVHCPESLPGQPHTSWPDGVTVLTVGDGGGTSATGDLATGACVNLNFAENSTTACFPGTRFELFEGNHVYYALDTPLPPQSVATIEVLPAPGVDVNLYGYRSGTSSFFVPPYVPSVSACEASHPSGLGSPPNPGAPEFIQFTNPSTTSEYNLFFAVAGPAGVTSGAYDVIVRIQTAQPHCPESLPGPTGLTGWPTSVTTLDASSGSASAQGDLANGACVNLDFASAGDIACFPATRDLYYRGHHVFYALDDLLMPGQTVTITAKPKPGQDVSLYGYLLGQTSWAVPPAVPSVQSCEASYPWTYAFEPNPGEPESIAFHNAAQTPRRVFFAVAGDAATGSAGGFDVDVLVE